MNVRTGTAAAVCALLLSACVTPAETISFSAEQASALNGRTMVPLTQAPPDYMPMRASAAAFGALGGLAMAAEARTFAEEHGIVDPASRIEDRLMTALGERYGLAGGQRLDFTTAEEGTTYPQDSNALYVDAKTYTWMESYFPANWGRFRIYYNVVIQLIDGATGQPVGQLDCKKVSHQSAENAPALEELDANNSALRNELLAEMALACATEFETIVLGPALATPPPAVSVDAASPPTEEMAPPPETSAEGTATQP